MNRIKFESYQNPLLKTTPPLFLIISSINLPHIAIHDYISLYFTTSLFCSAKDVA